MARVAPPCDDHVMTRRHLSLLLLAPLLLAGCGSPDRGPATSPSPEPSTSASETEAADWQTWLDEHATAAVADGVAPGFAMAHVGPDRDVTVAVAGQRSRQDATPLGPDAAFHLGSDTKAMTAVLLATYVQDGVLDLDAPLSELFPEAALVEPTASVTLRDVLGHRAGLSDDGLDLLALHAATDVPAARADAVVDALRAAGEPGTFAYANVGYMLAGAVAERIGGAPWEELLTDRVFEPLGMECGFGAPAGPGDPLGSGPDGAGVAADDPYSDNPAALGPAGTVHCPMADWAAFATAVLDGFRGEGSPVLGADAAADLLGGDEDYVAGWSRFDADGQTVWAHDGSNTLWYARAVLLVEEDEVLLLAANTADEAAVTRMDELLSTSGERG